MGGFEVNPILDFCLRMKSFYYCPYLVPPLESNHIQDLIKYDELRQYFVNT